MAQAAFGNEIFSKPVSLWLEWSGGTVSLAQVGADFVIAAEPCEVPPGEVNVHVLIGVKAYSLRYYLTQGLHGERSRSAITYLGDEDVPF